MYKPVRKLATAYCTMQFEPIAPIGSVMSEDCVQTYFSYFQIV